MDGHREDSSDGLQKGHVIQKGGTLVIGQDQDFMGGGFVERDAFGPGSVAELNMWGTVLSESDIVAQYESCNITEGSVHAWSQFKDADNWHGEVNISKHVCVSNREYSTSC